MKIFRTTKDVLADASAAYVEAMNRATVMLQREDVGWGVFGSGSTTDVIDIQTIKAHSERARRLLAYNPLVKRGVGIRNAYMWEHLPETKSEPLKPLCTADARMRDETAFCTDGMVLYVVDRMGRKAAPVPLNRVSALARAAGATGEADVFAFLIDPVPLSAALDGTVPKPDPEWIVVDGQPFAPVKDPSGRKTNPRLRAVYEVVNRQVGDEWGKPDLLGAVYWAQAYKEFLEAAHTMSKALARVAFKVTSMNAKQQGAVLSQMAGSQGVGGIASLGMGQEFQAVSKAGAGIEFSTGAPLAAMVSAALDVPLSVLLTDGSAGGRQGAEAALEDPTIKAFDLRRQLHRSLLEKLAAAMGVRMTTGTVVMAPLSSELVQRFAQAVSLAYHDGLLHQEEGRELMLRRLRPVNAKPVSDLPEPPDEPAGMDSETGVGPLSDGTNASRDGAETVA